MILVKIMRADHTNKKTADFFYPKDRSLQFIFWDEEREEINNERDNEENCECPESS